MMSPGVRVMPCVVLAQLLQLVAATFQAMAGDRLTAYVTGQVIHAANRWPGLARFEDPTFADDLHHTRTAASRGGLSIMVHGATGLMHLVTVVGASLVLLHLNPFVPVLLLLASLPAMARQWEYLCHVGTHLYDQTPEARRLAYYREMLLSAEPAKDVRLYGLGAFFRQRYEGLFAATMHALDELRRGLIRGVALAGAWSAAAMGLVYAICDAGGTLS
jgi:ATP-binding cassette, subfamily B, bacterial